MVMSERLTNWKPISSVSRSAIIADRGAKSRGGSVSGVPPFTASSPNLVSNAAARIAAASARRREARARPLPPAPFHARHAHVISARRLKARSWREQSSQDRKSVRQGKSVSVRVDFGGRRLNQKKK